MHASSVSCVYVNGERSSGFPMPVLTRTQANVVSELEMKSDRDILYGKTCGPNLEKSVYIRSTKLQGYMCRLEADKRLRRSQSKTILFTEPPVSRYFLRQIAEQQFHFGLRIRTKDSTLKSRSSCLKWRVTHNKFSSRY